MSFADLGISVSANPWRPDSDELAQMDVEESSLAISSYESEDFEADGSPWKFISTIEQICEDATDINALIDEIKNTSVKTDVREFVVNDVQVLKNNTSSASIDEIADISNATDMAVKVFYDEGDAWVELPIKKDFASGINVMSVNGNKYGFILPLDRADLLTNCLTCRFNCELNGELCEWCKANNMGYANRIHKGLDMSWSGIAGSNIRAVSSGTVTFRGVDPNQTGWGNYVSITHSNDNSIRTLYAHMQSAPPVQQNSTVNQGDIIGKVGHTGLAYGDHLHFEVYKNGTRVDPLGYLQGAVPFGSSSTSSELYLFAPGTYKICDGPLNLRGTPNSSTTSYGTLSNGTTVSISEIQKGDGTFVFGKISSGSYSGKWIALGKVGSELYAANTSVTWRVFDGPLNIRQSSSTSSTSYGVITNGSTFKITDVVKSGNYILAKVAASPAPTLASGSTCSVANAKNHWLALEYCEPVK